MAHHFGENIYTKSFTPREPNVELLDAASKRNTITCLCNSSGKSFVAIKLIQHVYNSSNLRPGTIALYVSDSSSIVKKQAGCIRRLTNLSVVDFDNISVIGKGKEYLESLKNQVLVMTTEIALAFFQQNFLNMSYINLLILHGCHSVLQVPSAMNELMKYYFDSKTKPHVLGLANSLFVSGIHPNEMEAGIKKMEELLNSTAETASNVVSALRYSSKPHEFVLECGAREKCPLDDVIEKELISALEFLEDHRFHPNEIYEGYVDELDIPDPTREPIEILSELLHILHTLGPWSTDRAALAFLIHIEKLKVVTPYERHFLLLSMTFTVVLKVHVILSHFFENISDRERIYKYTSPKILRLIEVLRKFQPEKLQSDCGELTDTEDDISRDTETSSAMENTTVNRYINEKQKLLQCVDQTLGIHDFRDNKSISVGERVNELSDISSNFRNCRCREMSEYLLKRLDGSDWNGISFKNTKSKFDENETDILISSEKNSKINEIHNVIPRDKVLEESGLNYSESEKLDKNNCLNNTLDRETNLTCDHLVVTNPLGSNYTNSEIEAKVESDARLNKSVEFVKKKNGYVQSKESQETVIKKVKQAHRNRNKKKIQHSKVNFTENHIQGSECVLLPKFRIDRYSRYEWNSGLSHMKSLGSDDFSYRQMKNFGEIDLQLCGLIFVEKKFTAKVLFQLLSDLKRCEEDFSFLNVQFTIGKLLDGNKDPKGAENEHRKQELVLKKFRTRECNLLIGTNFLEEGIDLPKCNLVVRFNVPKDYRSYVYTKERARAADSLFCLLVNDNERESFVDKLAEYIETEQILLKKCMNLEPSEEEEKEADQYVHLIKPFCPLLNQNSAFIDLSTAIALVNRYCAKLPSDTFTRLTPLWNIKSVETNGMTMFSCSIRLPINSPVKQKIEGCPMPTRVLARRFAAFQCCQRLHLEGELDDSLQPITKESFWMREEEQLTTGSEDREEIMPKNSTEPRPGTTKRRQYYYKRIADSLTDCRPVIGQQSFLYEISMTLTCPLPEEQNTRGRKIHAPEDSLQGFGILTSKIIPQIGAFPIFTRSGEVQVKLQMAQSDVLLSESQTEKIVSFIHYTFTSVLRLQRFLMMFDPNASENSYFIVPTKKDKESNVVQVDWEFLELIYKKKDHAPTFIPDQLRKDFVFDARKFEDAVVTPWYRNQQYFYVAEICYHLNPNSSFPGTEYDTFEDYYLKKYDIQIQNATQALLDVDHTSARLNFLTPRYVNRKGVALPTTSEEKKRAKRENLEQKQILIPELCNIHPFPGSLWRKAVCLPCILHRINALLLADQIRRVVANEIGVGIEDLESNFQWKPLDFGWSLSDVLAQSKAARQKREEKEKEKEKEIDTKELDTVSKINDNEDNENMKVLKESRESEEKSNILPLMEIGTWTNDMANNHEECKISENGSDFKDVMFPHDELFEESKLKSNGEWESNSSSDLRHLMRYGSPTTDWKKSGMVGVDLSDFCSDDSCSDDYSSDLSSNESDSDCGGLRIEFKEDNVAEAVENNETEINSNVDSLEEDESESWPLDQGDDDEKYAATMKQFECNIHKNKEAIIKNGILFEKDKKFDFSRSCKLVRYHRRTESVRESNEMPFGSSDNTFPQLIDEIPESLKMLPHTHTIIKFLEYMKKEKSNGFTKKSSLSDLVTRKIEEGLYNNFSFDEQPDLNNHSGPSPSLILQALTMSNANDGINLERLETIGDSFLKYAITAYLYCTYENVHEGKLSHLRSKQVSNYNLYRLGHKKVLGESMIATKFEPHDNWLPPCYYIPRELERALIKTGLPANYWNRADLPSLRNLRDEEICQLVREKGEKLGIVNSETGQTQYIPPRVNLENMPCFIPYNLMTQHSIPDKSIADCVEALIGTYLVACGPRGALLFMSWLGIKVLPREEIFFKSEEEIPKGKSVGYSKPVKTIKGDEEYWHQVCYGELKAPKTPLLCHVSDPEGELERLLRGFDTFENELGYHFRDRSYLLQALSHASYSPNRLTDCYQRLEFLGDAVLDYLITRHLYEDPRHHSPGALTDLRSALVNNTIFASLAVRHNFHKYFRHLCPGLNEVIDRFVRTQEENGHSINEEFYLIGEEECEEVEDVEVPKALGDIFESVAGAIFLDSGMSLDAVWKVYHRIMKKEIELFSTNVPKSPIRELFELEPETAQFGKPEKLADGKRVRVTVEVFGKGLFNGIGRNYRIAKCTAAKCALKKLKNKGLLLKRK